MRNSQKELVQAADQYLNGEIDSEAFKRVEHKYGTDYASIVIRLAKLKFPGTGSIAMQCFRRF